MKDKTHSRILMEAAKNGDIKTIKNLIEKGVNYKIKDDNLDTVFSIAARNGHLTIIDYLTNLEQKYI